MNQATAVIVLALAILIFAVPRRYFLLPFIIAACFVPADQQIIVLSLNLSSLRILLIAGVLRLNMRGESRKIQWNRFDELVLLWAFVGALIYIFQWMDFSAVVFKCGILFDILGWYWLFRVSVSSWEEVRLLFRMFAFCSIITVFLVSIEWSTGRNPFIVLGNVTTWIRDGRYRCQAAFPHSILLGLFWATLLPVFISLALSERSRQFYWTTVAASVFIVIVTASSTPIFTLLLVLLLMPMFRYRRYGQAVTWGLFAILVGLHLMMKVPVWHLISRVDVVGGSTGYHRYNLINQAIKHFSEWAILGCHNTSEWGYMLEDVTNQFIFEGVQGGFVTLVLFIILMILSIKTAGSYSLRRVPLGQQRLAWGICVLMLGHCISFFGVSYFGQIRVLLFLSFAIVGWIYGLPSTAVIVTKPNAPPQYISRYNGYINNYS